MLPCDWGLDQKKLRASSAFKDVCDTVIYNKKYVIGLHLAQNS